MDCSPDLVEDFEDLHNVVFLCPFCHEVVELFNNDLQFSIDMHSQNDTHITAYKNFQENNIAQKDKPPDIVSKSLDRQKNNAFILDSILKSVSVDIAPLNHTSFGNDNINFLDTDTDLSKSLNDKLVLKENSCKLERLFMQLPTGFEYNIPYISMVGQKLFCYLCNCVIVISLDEVVLRTNLKKHLEGSHKQNYLKELIKLLPKEQIEDENYFILQLGRMMCKLCKVPICMALSGLKSTFYNVIIHLRGKKHKTNLNTHFEDYSGLKQIFVKKLPKTIERDKFYLTKNGECYKCVLCNKNISLSGQDVSQTRLKFISHLNSNNHLNKVKIFENFSPSSDYEYLKQKIYPLKSQIIEQNMKHIIKIDDKWFKCTLCAVQLEIFSEPSVTVSQFSQHLKSKKHKQKVANTENESNEKVNQVSQETSGNTNPKKCSNDDFDRLKTKLKGFPVPQIFDENRQFIIVYKKHFKCTLCEAILQVSPIPSITIENFTQHLQSKFHKQNEKKVDLMKIGNNDFSWEKLIGKNNIPDIIEQNKQFVVKNKTFMCILCNTELKISSKRLCNRENFAKHFHLLYHKLKKIEYEKHLAESINPSEYFNQSKSVDTNPSISTPNNEYGILEEAFGSFHQLQLVQENKQFIMKLKTHFKCSLCDVQLAVTSDPETNILLFSQHLESVFHKQNKQDLENQIVNENVSLRSSVNIALNSSSIDNECEFLSFEAALGTHYELELIKHNTQYLIKEGNFFKCTLCDLQIQLSSEIALNVLRLLQHLKSEIHIQNRTEHVFKYLLQQATTTETVNTLLTNFQKDYLYLKALLDPYPVPQFIEQNKKFIVKNGTHYKCTLCDSHLEVSFDPRFTRTNFALHLDCSSHEQKRIEYEKRIAQTANSVENLNTNGNVDMNPNISNSNNDFGVLKKIFGIFHELKLIQENKQFIVKLKKHVQCSLCDVQLSVSTDHEKNILLFSQHLESMFHKHNKRDRRNDIVVNSTSIENELQFLSLEAALGTYYELQVIKHNTQYLIIEGNLFKCTLCNSQFSVSSEICINLLRLSLHLKSEVHKENRTEHVFKQLMQQAANSQNMNTPSNIDYLYLQALLDPYPTPQYVERNKQFIVKNGSNFKCILCNANLKVSTDPQSTILELSAHFEIGFHNGKKVDHEKHSIQNASNITLGTQANSVSWPSSSFLNANKEDLQSLEAVLGTFPRVIEQNKQYIVKLGNHFKCVLCNEQLKVLSDSAKTVSQFTQHFHSIFHKQNRINHNIYLEAQSAKPIPKSPPTTSKQNTITQQEKDYLNLKILLGPYSNLSIIEQNKQFIVKDGNHFKCTLCDASISVSSDIATVSKKLMEHFEGKAHKKKEKMSKDQNIQSGNLKENLVQSESNVNNKTSSDKHKSDFLSLKAFLKPYPIPEIFEKNKDCIVRDGGDFKCTLCNVPLKLLSDVSTTVQQFSQHLKGAKHKRLFKFRFAKVKLEKGMHSTLSAETNTDNEHPDYIYLKEILHPLKIPRIFEQNKGYLVKKGNNFECILCDAELMVSTVASKIVFEFSKHLNCANHKRKLRNFEAVKVNSKYLSQSGSNFECSLCKTKFGTASNFQNMIHQFFQHFIGVNHVKNVQALSNIKTTTSDKKQSQPSNVSSGRSTDCNKDVVSGLKEVLQVNVLPQIIAQNRDYIVKSGDHYLCSLCKAQLSVTPNASSTIHQFSQHLSSNRHCGKVAELKNTLPTASSETESSKNPSNNTQHTTSTSVQDQVSNSLKEVFYPYNIPHTIKVNLSHIRKMGDHYACVTCGVQLSVTSKPYFTILNFVQHLGSKNHTSKVSKPVKKS